MVENVSGEIKVKIEGGESPGVTGAPGAGGASAEQKKVAVASGGTLKTLSRYASFMMGLAGIAGILKQSKAFSTMLTSTFELLGSIVDMFLAPFMPIFASMFEAVAPYLKPMFELWQSKIAPVIENKLPEIVATVDNLMTLISSSLPEIITIAKGMSEFLLATIAPTLNAIKSVITLMSPAAAEEIAPSIEGTGIIEKAINYLLKGPGAFNVAQLSPYAAGIMGGPDVKQLMDLYQSLSIPKMGGGSTWLPPSLGGAAATENVFNIENNFQVTATSDLDIDSVGERLANMFNRKLNDDMRFRLWR